jgi:hypothetical protein
MNSQNYLEETRREIEALQINLIRPTLFEFRGVYFYSGRNHIQKGRLMIGDNFDVVGEIIDSNSTCPLHIVQGRISNIEKMLVFNFVQKAKGKLDIYYALRKSVDGEGIPGRYTGMWSFSEQGILLEVGYDPHFGERVMVRHPESCNKTRLILRRANSS